MSSPWWEKCLEQLPPEVAKERRRVLQLLDAHESHLGAIHVRLCNLIANGIDLEEEAKRGPADRPTFFDWPDGRQT